MSSLHVTLRGSGYPVVFIHGFPFNSRIWDLFAIRFEKSFKLILPDLPGFGQSPALPRPFTIEDVAKSVSASIAGLGIREYALVGHSLGGYVALAMAEQDPEMISRVVLFHSTAYADSSEKRDNRNKVIEFVQRNGAEAFTGGFITPLFADQGHADIEGVRQIANEAGQETVIGYTEAMRDRRDRTSVLKQFHKPILIVAGERDAGIPTASVKEQAALSALIQLRILDGVAHMGMFEKPDESAAIIRAFLASK